MAYFCEKRNAKHPYVEIIVLYVGISFSRH